MSHPVWVCVLKLRYMIFIVLPLCVTPCMGVCIETLRMLNGLAYDVSHPVWVCVLKLNFSYLYHGIKKSHPVWVCVLKP